MFEKLHDLEARFEDVTRMLAMPEIASNPNEFRKYAREHRHLEELVETWRRWVTCKADLAEGAELIQGGDAELRELALAEREELTARLAELEQTLKLLLLPRDPNDDRNTVLEVRAGTGGDEAALFAADLLRMYLRYAEARGWRVEMLNAHESDLGGFKEVAVLITGEGVYRHLKFEGGVHRVQRVPATESQGRIHTSACTVAIMPEAEEVDVDIQDAELRIDTYRASGAGGQHVNKTESAIRITHLPTGLVVQCQDEKSQHKNKAKAMKVLRSKLLQLHQEAADKEHADARRVQVGSGDRSERIRTYNYPQNRVTDHRIGLTLYKLDAVMEGALDEVLEPLMTHFQTEALRREGFAA